MPFSTAGRKKKKEEIEISVKGKEVAQMQDSEKRGVDSGERVSEGRLRSMSIDFPQGSAA